MLTTTFATLKKSTPFKRSTLLGLVLLLVNASQAQDAGEIAAARLLFEPKPIPAAGTAEPTFITQAQAISSATISDAIENIDEEKAKQDALLQEALSTNGESGKAAAQAYRAYADWQLKAFLNNSSIASSIPSMNNAAFANMRNSSPQGGSAADVINANNANSPLQTTFYNLYLARSNYLKGLSALAAEPDYSNPDFLVMERQFLKTLFLNTHRENIIYDPDFYLTRRSSATGTRLDTSTQDLLNSDDYDQGIVSFQRALSYIDQNKGRTAEQIAGTLLEEADWDLLFARIPQATEKYDSAFQFFENSPVIKERAAALITPSVPVVLPAFMPTANSRERLGITATAEVPYFGYFDVTFSIQKNGRARGIKIFGQGGNVTDTMETRLKEYLGKLTFRPRYTAGKLDTEAQNLRYYVGY